MGCGLTNTHVSLSQWGAQDAALLCTAWSASLPSKHPLTASRPWLLWIALCSGGGSSYLYLVMARTGEPGPKGISAFLLEKVRLGGGDIPVKAHSRVL